MFIGRLFAGPRLTRARKFPEVCGKQAVNKLCRFPPHHLRAYNYCCCPMATFSEPSTSTSTTVTLGKRKHRNSLVIHLSSPSPSCDNDPAYTESEYDTAQLSDASIPISKKNRNNEKKRYVCAFEGCSKSYTKPSRLEEHERSHTGDVSLPFTYCFST